MSFIKRQIVKVLLRFLSIIDLALPEIRKMHYRGYVLYFSRGTSLVNRIRLFPASNRNSIYEPETAEAIQAILQGIEKPVIADVGSNIGLMSLNILATKPEATIYAFEPGPHQRMLFEKTIQVNPGMDRKVFLSDYALSNNTGTSVFATHHSKDVSGDGLVDTGRAGETKTITVRTIKFDEWWMQNGKPKFDFIKIDTEGAELWILQGAEAMIAQLRPVLLLEIFNLNLVNYPYKSIDIMNWLKEHRYNLYSLSGVPVTDVQYFEKNSHEAEFIARPN